MGRSLIGYEKSAGTHHSWNAGFSQQKQFPGRKEILAPRAEMLGSRQMISSPKSPDSTKSLRFSGTSSFQRFSFQHFSITALGLLGILSVVFVAGSGLATVVAAENPPEKTEGKPAPAKTYTGTLKTGVMAIGGETTGITLTTADDGIYELDLGADKELKKKADELNGKKVTVVGEYKPKEGVEKKERRIIATKSLGAAE